jgi:uncharacterized membrane protein YkoI
MKYRSLIIAAATALCLNGLPAQAQYATPQETKPSVSTTTKNITEKITTLFEKEEIVQWADVPADAQKAITDNAHGGKVEKITKETKDDKAVYDAKILTADSPKIKMKVQEDGKLLEFRYARKRGKEITWTDVPAAAQKSITDKAYDGTVEKIEKQEKDGGMLYEATIKSTDNKSMEIKVNQDGELIELKTEKDLF